MKQEMEVIWRKLSYTEDMIYAASFAKFFMQKIWSPSVLFVNKQSNTLHEKSYKQIYYLFYFNSYLRHLRFIVIDFLS